MKAETKKGEEADHCVYSMAIWNCQLNVNFEACEELCAASQNLLQPMQSYAAKLKYFPHLFHKILHKIRNSSNQKELNAAHCVQRSLSSFC